MRLSEALSRQARDRGNLKQRAAKMVAGIMMAHFDGPFEDSSFYDDDEDQEAVAYFDEARRDLYDDSDFRRMVIKMITNELGFRR